MDRHSGTPLGSRNQEPPLDWKSGSLRLSRTGAGLESATCLPMPSLWDEQSESATRFPSAMLSPSGSHSAA